MLNHKQIKKMVQVNGQLNEAYKEIRRYGEITYDKSWEVDSGYYQGSNRHMIIVYRGRRYDIDMINGDVWSFGWDE